ncbi:helix-turn-helix domain-containing protein [Amaricoccus sp.]|uniref:winged helix-turn-helix domain-containing protein n=1 Tax=Amaricoccus sp. TaxID=1872485 RepID=UPI001B4338FE|nr:helix-turn-helix domain-containing protein [Amaricoccus sp.]MBP7001705.1 winged helix-turn-helix domain-containing protein [Amaricoccus sp.]
MLDLSDRPDPECLSFDQLIEECHALRAAIATLQTAAAGRKPRPRPTGRPRTREFLTPLEGRLLARLGEDPGKIVSAQALAEAIRPSGGPVTPDRARALVGVYLHRLRPKLAASGLWIATAHGRGYSLEGDPDLARRTSAEIHAGGRAAPVAVRG